MGLTLNICFIKSSYWGHLGCLGDWIKLLPGSFLHSKLVSFVQTRPHVNKEDLDKVVMAMSVISLLERLRQEDCH